MRLLGHDWEADWVAEVLPPLIRSRTSFREATTMSSSHHNTRAHQNFQDTEKHIRFPTYSCQRGLLRGA